MTSLTPRHRRSRAAAAAQRPPPAHPARAITGSISQASPTGKNRATPVAVRAPTYSWPSPPTFTSPTRVGMAVAKAVSSRGIIVTPTSLRPRELPKTPSQAFSSESSGSRPEAARNTAKTARASDTPRSARAAGSPADRAPRYRGNPRSSSRNRRDRADNSFTRGPTPIRGLSSGVRPGSPRHARSQTPPPPFPGTSQATGRSG